MKEVCELTGLKYETLKFYCNEGLVPNVSRNVNNHRVFSDDDLRWIRSIGCLKRCGMPLADMKTYVKLCMEGEGTIAQRTVMLDERRQRLLESIKELEKAVAYIDWKKDYYASVLSGERNADSPVVIPEEFI
ncbi:MAG: MerR family transcriptional regulator [Bullifex sp.]